MDIIFHEVFLLHLRINCAENTALQRILILLLCKGAHTDASCALSNSCCSFLSLIVDDVLPVEIVHLKVGVDAL